MALPSSFGPMTATRHADDRERDDDEDAYEFRPQRRDQPPERAAEVLGLLGREPGSTERTAATEPARGRSRAAGRAGSAGAAGPPVAPAAAGRAPVGPLMRPPPG